MNAAQDLVSGRYRLLEIIGAGGMGRVWLADDELLRRRVAVKEISTPTDVSTSEMLDLQLTTMREARAAARLDHPGVVAVYDVVWRPGRSWIVMEYVESRSLHDVVRDDGPMPHREAARIGLGVLTALRAAHAAGVLHRDVKPHNVLLAQDGRVVLTDFGLAKVEGHDHGPDPLLGSPYFIAPERLRGDESSPAADLWSLGATLYAAVEGQAPFKRTTTTASLTALVTEPPDPQQHPGPLSAVIDGLLVKDPAHRMTAEQAEAHLRRVNERVVGIFPVRIPRQRPATSPSTGTVFGGATATPAAPPAGLARTTKIAIAVAAALLAGTAGVALVLDSASDGTPGAAATNNTAVTAMIADDCGPGGSVVSGSKDANGLAVPAGWLWHTDPTGFAVAVPQGWTRTTDGTAACFQDPEGSREFRVDASARPTGTPLAYWQEQEKNVALPGYERISLGAVTLKQGAAAWEFTWLPAGQTAPRHERRVLMSMGGGRAYLVEWTTRDQDWSINEAYLQLILASLT